MARADLVKRNKKEYVAVQCDICGHMNYFGAEQAITVLANKYALHCKRCGSELKLMVMDPRLERRVKARRKRRLYRW